MTERRSLDCTIKGVQSSDAPFDFVLSSDTPDRMGDVINQKGWKLSKFKSNPIALFGHDNSFPIGKWKNIKVKGNRLIASLDMAKEGTSERIDEIRSLIEQGILKAVSVGFRVLDYEPIDEKDPWGAWNIKKAELLETSVVTVPANPDALSLAKSLGVSKGTQRIVFGTGKQATSKPPQPAKQAPADYSDLIGTPSEVLRRNRLIY